MAQEHGVICTSDSSPGLRTAIRANRYAARRAAWEAAGIKYLKWHSILDKRTTLSCATRAGKIYDVDFAPVGHGIPMGPPPPAHWNCRSILVGMAPDYAPPGDGQDPYSESLDDWLKRQTPEAQDEMLGPVRAALWRAGKLDARGLLGPGGEVLSVAELAAAYPDSAYDVAKANGRYKKFLDERENYSDAQLRKSARSYERTTAEHEAYIADPSLKLPRDTQAEAVRLLVEKKWPADIRRNKVYLEIVEDIFGASKI